MSLSEEDLVQQASAESRATKTLGAVLTKWKRSGREGERFAVALVDWLRKQSSPATRRSYGDAIEDWFDWWTLVRLLEVPLPNLVRRSDATDYVNWHRSRKRSLAVERLERDTGALGRAARFITDHGPVSAREASRALGLAYANEGDMASRYREALQRQQRSAMARAQQQPEGEYVPNTRGGVAGESLSPVLTCLLQRRVVRVVGVTQEGAFRSSMLAVTTYDTSEKQRYANLFAEVAPLSSFWSFCKESGENDGSRALLEHDIWKPFLGDMASRARMFQDAMAPVRMVTTDILQLLLQTTRAQRPVDLRDRLLILMLAEMGLRSAELVQAKREDVRDGKLHVVGKGDKLRIVPITKNVAITMQQLDAELARRQNAAELRSGRAALVPVLHEGVCHNTTQEGLHMGTSNVRLILLRRGQKAGIGRGDPRRAALHPHALRKWFSRWQASHGRPLPVVQAMLGHASLSTTGLYTKVAPGGDLHVDPLRLPELEAAVPAVEAEPPPPSPVVPAQAPRAAQPVPAPRAAAPASPPAATVAPAPPPAATPSVVVETLTPTAMAELEQRMAWEVTPFELPKEPVIAEAVVPRAPAAEPKKTRKAQRAVVTRAELVDAFYPASFDDPRWGGKEKTVLHTRAYDAEDMLTTTYVDRRTGLLWWWGPGNLLRPQAPVVSPEGWREPIFEQAVTSLQTSWSVTRPTSSFALVRWLGELGNLTTQVDGVAASLGIEWRAFEDQSWALPAERLRSPEVKAAIEQAEQRLAEAERARQASPAFAAWQSYQATTKAAEDARAAATKGRRVSEMPPEEVIAIEAANPLPASLPSSVAAEARRIEQALTSARQAVHEAQLEACEAFRRHDAEQVVRWLRARADAYGLSKGDKDRETRLLVERTPTKAPWFMDDDPILSLPEEEQEDLRDWLAVLTGKYGAMSKRKRYTTRAGKQVSRADLAGVLGIVAMAMHEEESAAQTGSKLTKQTVALHKAFEDHMKRLGVTGPDGAPLSWKAFRTGGGTDKKRIFSALLGLIAGDEAKGDWILVAMKDDPPLLASNAEWFRWPATAPTIEHTIDFQRQMAKSGIHSECTARRLARAMWDAVKTRASVGGADLEQIITQYMSFWLPCPASLESELVERRHGAPLPAWATAVRRTAEQHAAEVGEEVWSSDDSGSRFDDESDYDEKTGSMKTFYTPNAARALADGLRLLPNPVAVLRSVLP